MTNADITYDRPEVIGNLISVSGSWSASVTGKEVHLDLSPYMNEVLSVFIAPQSDIPEGYSKLVTFANTAGNGGLGDNAKPDGYFPEIKPLIDKDDPAKVTFFSDYVTGTPDGSLITEGIFIQGGTWSTGSTTVTHTAIDETISGPLIPGMLVWEENDDFGANGRLITGVTDATHFVLNAVPASHANSGGSDIYAYGTGEGTETKDMVLVSNDQNNISKGNFIVIGRK